MYNLKPRANGRNIVGPNNSQHCWMLHVASVCKPCCILLGSSVAQSFKAVKLLSQRFPTFLLFCDRRSVAHNVGSVCTALLTLFGPRTHTTHGLQSVMGCIIPTMQCGSQVASVYNPLPTWTQQLPALYR